MIYAIIWPLIQRVGDWFAGPDNPSRHAPTPAHRGAIRLGNTGSSAGAINLQRSVP